MKKEKFSDCTSWHFDIEYFTDISVPTIALQTEYKNVLSSNEEDTMEQEWSLESMDFSVNTASGLGQVIEPESQFPHLQNENEN